MSLSTGDAAGTPWPPALPLVAILRGLQPEHAEAVGDVLFAAGLRVLEVPLNRPGALKAIAALVRIAPSDALVGAGTVTDVSQVDAVAAAGGRLIVAPHFDPQVVARARTSGLRTTPGVFTPTEAFAALRAGADALKFFPAEALGPAGLRSVLSVLPPGTLAWPVGGIDVTSLAPWRAAGANGFGIGSALFTPALELDELTRRAAAIVAAWRTSAT